MELQITSKNIELTPVVRGYVERKLGKLSRHLPNITVVKAEIYEGNKKSPQQRFVVQVTVDSSGTLIRGEERAEDLFKAVDGAAAIVNRQIEHYKGKRYHKGRGSSLARGELKEKTLPASPHKLVKVKRFTVKPMSMSEAIEQMELLGHDFFLFFNADAEELNLLYRRKDGDYGLIETELG